MSGSLAERVRHAGRLALVRRGVAEGGRRVLRAVGGSGDVTFITGPGNLGDHLIHAGTRRLLRGIPYREVRLARTRRDGVTGLEDLGGHTALVTGGGGWCHPFRWVWPVVLGEIEERFERVVVLPSTVDASSDAVRQTLSRTKALVFARERESYRQLQGLCRTELAHDAAFFYDFSPYLPGRPGAGTLVAYRTDAEAAGGPLPPGNEDISRTCSTLDEFLWKIARHATVETDRAHVMIAAAMLGKTVRYRASNYHKVPSIADHSLKRFPVQRLPGALPPGKAARTARPENARFSGTL